ncbi:hypothetical protein FRC12_013823 [Ceratobasidium sp. 428]|nr:hypothetical protein FRC12_013823 [Ceratobasidium sp. 428]
MPCLPYKCAECQAKFKTKPLLRAHISTHPIRIDPSTSAGPSSLDYICPYCRQSLTSNAGLTQHIRNNPACSAANEESGLLPVQESSASEGSSQETQTEHESGSGSESASKQDAHSQEGSARSLEGREGGQGEEGEGSGDVGDGHGSVRGDSGGNDGETEANSESERESKDNSDSNTEHKDNNNEGWDEIVAEQARMDLDLPNIPNPPSPSNTNTSERNIRLNLREATDEYGTKVWIEDYPVPTMGKAIREGGAPKGKYPDVGALSNPESFEIAKLLLELGMSVQNRNCYLRLKCLRGMMPWSAN